MRLNSDVDMSKWKVTFAEYYPKLYGSIDYAIFVLKFVDCISSNKEFNVTQEDM